MKSNIVRDIDLEKVIEESKSKLGSTGYYRVQCCLPGCTGSSLSMSVRHDFKVGYCFRCGTLFLPNQGRLPIEESLTIIEEVTSSFIHSINSLILDVIGEPVPPEGIEYLTSRNPYVKDWSKYKQRYEVTDDKIMILTPYFINDSLVYYQVRFQTPQGRRFENPKLPKSVYLPNGFDNSRSTIIVEGPFDAIAVDCLNLNVNIIALGGCEISKDIRNQLNDLGVINPIIFLDDTSKSNKVAKLLNSSRIISSDGDDPEELLVKYGYDKVREVVSSKL